MNASKSILNRFSIAFALVALGLLALFAAPAEGAVTVTLTNNVAGTNIWVCPLGVSSIQVECWGGGGAGGAATGMGTASSNTSRNGGGGGGGAYARRASVPVTPGQSYTITIPSAAVSGANGLANGAGVVNGNNITFVGDSAVTVTAAGGSGGQCASNSVNGTQGATGGAGGTTASSVGDFKFAGGLGWAGNVGATNTAGGGGGAAGNANAGGNAYTNFAGLGGSIGGGNGGNAPLLVGNGTSGAGNNGATPGGGGGGAKYSSASNGTKLGGTGGLGQTVLTYTYTPNVKTNNTDNLNLASSWTVGVPLTNQAATWDSTVTGPNTTVLGANMTFGGLSILNPGGLVTISADGNTLTNNGAIDMSLANADLTLNCNLVLGAANVWNVTNTHTLTVGGTVSGAFAVTKQGAGTAILSGPNTYSGVTTVSAGTLQLGNATALGTTAGNTTIASGATLDLNGQTIAEPFGAIVGTGVGATGALINSSGTAAAITGTITTGANSFTVGGSGNITLATLTLGGGTLTKIGGGTLTLGGTADNVSLVLAVNAGIVVLGKTSTTGAHAFGNASSIGNGGTIQLGGTGDYQMYGGSSLTVNSGGVFDLNGKNQNYNALAGNLNLNGTGISSGGALINSQAATTSTLTFGTGNLVLQSASLMGGAGNISVTSSSTGGLVTGGFALTKVGAGTLTLSGVNTYTGNTTISAGLLALSGSGSIANSPNITVASNAVFDVSGGSFALGGSQTLGNSAPGALLSGNNDCSVGTLSLVYDGVNASFTQTNGTMTLSASTVVTVNDTGAILGANHTNVLIAAATAGNPGSVTGTLPGVVVSGSGALGVATLLIDGAGNLDLVIGPPQVWTGGASPDPNWTTVNNWASGASPTDGGLAVFNNLSTQNLATVLNQNFNLTTLSVFDPSGPVSIDGSSGTYTLAITNGINMALASQPLTITAPVVLGASQTWTVTNAQTLTVNGAVSGGAGLTVSGGGTVIFTNANSYNGGTIINAGTLQLSGSGTPGAGGSSVAVSTNALLDLNGTSQSIAFTAGTGVGTVANNSGSGTNTLTLTANPAANVIIRDSTNNSGGKVAVVVAATTQAPNNANTYSGGTTVNAGTWLYLNASTPLGAGTGPINLLSYTGVQAGSSGLVVDNVTYSNDITGAGYVHFNANSGATVVTATFTGNINTSGPFIFRAGTGITYNFAGNGTTSVLSGVIGSTVSMVNGAVATGNVLKSGTGLLTLGGANIYTGTTTVSGGELDISNWGAAGLAAISVGGVNGATLGIFGGTLSLGSSAYYVGTAVGSGIVNQTNGTVSANNNLALLLGNGGSGTYNLSGGTLTITAASATRGVMMGVNGGNWTNIFNLSGTGNLAMGLGELALGRNDSPQNPGGTCIYSQSGGTAAFNYLSIGNGTSTAATFVITNGTFTATNFQAFVPVAASSATLYLGGGAQVTLPAFPAKAGTATNTFDFTTGYLAPVAASASYMPAGTFNIAYLTTNGVNFNVASANGITVAQVLTNAASQAGTLTKSGTGILTLSGANTYTGNTTINAGELKFSTAGSGASTVTAAAGATNGILVAANNGQWATTGNWTNQTGSVLHIDYSNNAPTTAVAPLQVASFVTNSSLTLQVDGLAGGFVIGQTYPLVAWTGSGPVDASAFTTVVLPGGVTGTLSVTGGNTLALTVTDNTSVLTWNIGDGTWDTGTPNWLNSSLASVAYTDPVNAVVFDDAAGVTAGDHLVTLNSAYSPQGVLMKSTSHNYNISGTGGIGGSTGLTLDPANTMTLTLSNVNTYTGPTIIGGGKLTIGGLGRLGSGSYAGAIAIANGATFEYSSTNTQTLSGNITGAGALTADSTNANNLSLSGTANTYSGLTTISGGIRIQAGPANLSPSTAFNIVGNSSGGGQLYLNAGGTVPNNFTLSGVGYADTGGFGGAIRANGNLTFTGTINLAGNARIGYIGTSLVNNFNGQISGGNGIEFATLESANSTTGTFTLGNTGTANNYTGNTAISDLDFGGPFTGSSCILKLTAGEQIPNGPGAGLLVFNGADANHLTIFELNGFNETVDGITNVAAAGAIIRNTTTGASLLKVGDGDTNSAFSGTITDGGTTASLALTKIGAGTLTLSSASSAFTGNLTISNGTVTASGSTGGLNPTKGSLGNPQTAGRQITVGSGGTLTFAANDVLGNAASLPLVAVVVNGGTINNGGSYFDTFNSLTLNGGTLNSVGGVNASFPSFQFNGPVTVGGSAPSTISGSGTFSQMCVGYGTATTFNVADVTGDSGSDLNVSVVLQDASGGTKGLIKTGLGTMTLSGTNSFTGNILVSGGTLAAAAAISGSGSGNPTALGSASNTRTITVNSGGTLAFFAPNVFSHNFADTVTPTLNINGGTVTNANPGAVPNGINNALNNVILTNGTLSASVGQVNGYAAWNVNGTITSSGNSFITTTEPVHGTVMLTSAGNASTTINVGDGTLTINAPLVESDQDGDISGLTLTGAGTLILSGASTYSGGTLINGGTLLVNNTSGTGTGTNAVTINSGATLGGIGSIMGLVTNNAGGILTAGTNGIGTLTMNGNLTLNAGSTNTFVVNGSAPANTSVALGAAVTYGGVLNIVTNGTFSAGQQFILFSGPGATNTGNFASIAGSPGGTLFFSFTNGVLSVNSTAPAQSSVGYLLTLVVSNNLNAAVNLNPGFTTNLPSGPYAATNTLPASQVNVTVTDVDPTATNTLSLNGGSPVLLPSGVTSSLLSLNPGSNNVTVQVVSQDLSVTNTYTVNVFDQPSQTVPVLTNSVSGGTNLVLSWAGDHLGYRLLMQTNNLAKGVSSVASDWGTVPGSSSVTATNILINKAGGTNEFYRLVYP